MIYGPSDLSLGAGKQNNPRWRVFDVSLSAGLLRSISFQVTEDDSRPMFALFKRESNVNSYIRGLGDVHVDAGIHTIEVNWPIPEGAYFGVWGEGVGVIKGAWPEGHYQDTTSIMLSAYDPNIDPKVKRQAVSIDVDHDAVIENPTTCSVPIAPLTSSKVYFGVAGQSNAEGSADAGYETERQEFGALSFNKSNNQIIPATSDGSHEYVGFGASAYLNQRAYGPQVISGRNGNGGASMAALSKGSAPYANGITQWEEAALQGADHLGQFWVWGEAGARDQMSRLDTKNAHIQLANDYAVDVDQLVKTYVAQLSSYRNTWQPDATWNVALGQFDAGRERSRVHVACPTYMLRMPRGEEVHYDGPSVRLLGAYLMRAALTQELALQVIDAHRDGALLILTYNKSGLEFDDYTFRQPNYGFRAFGTGGNDVDIDSVEIIDCNQVALKTIGNDWSYGNMRFRGREKWAGLGGNLRDCAGYSDVFDGVPLHNWALLQTSLSA